MSDEQRYQVVINKATTNVVTLRGSSSVASVSIAAQRVAPLEVRIHRANGDIHEVPVLCRIDTAEELTYYRHGGILPYVYRELVAQIRQH